MTEQVFSTCSASAGFNDQQNTNPSICNLPSSHYVRSLTPVTETVLHYVGADRVAARIAANAVEQIDQLALIGYPTSLDEQTRDVVETAIRLVARKVLES